MQKLNIELGILQGFRPFLFQDTLSVPVFYHIPAVGVLQDIALFEKPLLDTRLSC
jgi:hypothetical protein